MSEEKFTKGPWFARIENHEICDTWKVLKKARWEE